MSRFLKKISIRQLMKNFFIVLGIIFSVLILVVTITGTTSCVQTRKILPFAEKFSEDFFIQFNNNNFEYIYDTLSDPRFKMSQSKKYFIELLKTIYKKIGKFIKKTKLETKFNSMPDGVYFGISYATSHENGSAVETFTLRKNDDKWLLIEYNIMSKELILK